MKCIHEIKMLLYCFLFLKECTSPWSYGLILVYYYHGNDTVVTRERTKNNTTKTQLKLSLTWSIVCNKEHSHYCCILFLWEKKTTEHLQKAQKSEVIIHNPLTMSNETLFSLILTLNINPVSIMKQYYEASTNPTANV